MELIGLLLNLIWYAFSLLIGIIITVVKVIWPVLVVIAVILIIVAIKTLLTKSK